MEICGISPAARVVPKSVSCGEPKAEIAGELVIVMAGPQDQVNHPGEDDRFLVVPADGFW
jgi:hypothetical protein